MPRYLRASLLLTLVLAACASGVPSQQPSANPTLPAPVTPLPSATVARASGQIAFVRGLPDASVDLFIADPDGSNLKRLTVGGGAEHGLIWAPDGSRLYYESEAIEVCGDSYCFPTHLFSIRADGTDTRDLGLVGAGPDDWSDRGAISPDGRFAAYGDNSGMGSPLVIVDLTSSTTRTLPLSVPDPIWSPEGTRLLVYSLLEPWVGIVDMATGRFIAKANDPLVQGIIGWTADGSSILYQRCDSELGKQAVMECMAGPPWIAPAKSGGLAPVQSAEALPAGIAILAPDGTRSATMLDDGLHVGRAGEAGRLLAPVSQVNGVLQLPTWSPDGDWIAFAGGANGSVISVVAAAGGAPTVLGPGDDPAWQPAP